MEIVDPAQQQGDRVRFGATVTVRDDAGDRRTYRIVGVDEAEASSGKVSWLSPVARAILGKEEGDRVDVELPHGRARLEIIEIAYHNDE